ncbi:hypothetical protein LSTR_LSTR005835 [Laodelphax striatellus]|uniref:SAM domain-containing protein n=1 Tax=Laodelphax striatellus TaxID=195883 RepID=A0A482WQX6_LAOST|nr:hypothetical protein LSTR_LSTR005835 [Laodelphax striatellus]
MVSITKENVVAQEKLFRVAVSKVQIVMIIAKRIYDYLQKEQVLLPRFDKGVQHLVHFIAPLRQLANRRPGGNEIEYAEISETNDMDMLTACALQDTDLVKTLINRRKNLSRKNKHGWTPLMYACYYGSVLIVNELISVGADKCALNNNGQSSFSLAVMRNHVKIMELVYARELLKKTDKNGCSPLNCAIEYGCYDSIRWLLERGADPNAVENNEPLLSVAVALGNETIVKYLLKFGADPLKTNSKGETAEMIAAKNNYHSLVTLIQFRVSAMQNLQKLFQMLSLEKYWPIMRDNNIDMDKFLKLTENDLQNLGVNLLGPRRKMSMAITSLVALRHKEQHNPGINLVIELKNIEINSV